MEHFVQLPSLVESLLFLLFGVDDPLYKMEL